MTRNGFLALCLIAMVLIFVFAVIYKAIGNFLNAGYAAHKRNAEHE